MGIFITALSAPPAASLPVEMVERKGTGHPDTICDAIAEEFSRALSRHYLERFGLILHHNVDKGLLWGGAARPVFGGGEVVAPIELYLAGRATREVDGVKVPVEDIAAHAAREWLRNNLRALDADRHVRIHCLVRPSSSALVELFRRQSAAGLVCANDTSYGVGFAPLDDLENVVLEAEKYLNSAAARVLCPAIGEDIKVMGVREGGAIHLTVACAMIAAQVADLHQYFAHKAQVVRLALAAARTVTAAPVAVDVNTADGDTPDSIYLTVTGTSAEAGDDGEVGRGNRANGLITPCRPMSLEAAAGKNPVNHVGKIYNLAAGRIAHDLVHEIEEVSEAHCCLVSDIGMPIDRPRAVDVRVRLEAGAALAAIEPRVDAIVRAHLAGLATLWRDVVSGALSVW
jgi:S-adenosylmethionine synthetase